MVEVVQARTQLRRAGARWTGRCPFHEEQTPSFSVNPADKLYYCFGCGKGGDVITFVRETEQLDFAAGGRVAGRALPRARSSTRSRSPRAGRRARPARAAARAARAGDELLRAPPLGVAARRVGARVPREPRPRRGGLPRVPARARAGRRDPRAEGAREGLHRAGAARRRARQPPRQRLLHGAAALPARRRAGRVRGFQARKLREDDPLRAKYVNSPEGELFRKGDLLYGLDRARSRDRQAGARGRRRGQHRRARAAPGRARAGRRLDGHGAHRAPAEGALAPDAQGSGSASTATRPARRRRCAGWSSRPRRASTCGW